MTARSCRSSPLGTVAYGGGGTVHHGSVYDVRGLSTCATEPDGRSWTYAAGGELHTADSAYPSRLGILRASEMTPDDCGWFAAADVYSPWIELTAKVRCTDRLG